MSSASIEATMHLFGLRGYGIGTYAIIVLAALVVIWPLRVMREHAILDVPGWAEQLIFWWTIAAANLGFSRWLDGLENGKVVRLDPADPKRLVLVRPEHHTALWIPVRHWTLIFMLIGIYGSLTMWGARS
jgi:hypothetical protein